MDSYLVLAELLEQYSGLFPAPPQRLLLIDAGHQLVAGKYDIGGCQITAVKCFGEQEFIQAPSSTRTAIHPVTFVVEQSSNGIFPACMVLNFSPSVHSLDLFDKVFEAMEFGGRVLLVGMKLPEQSLRLTNWLSHTSTIAQRCGFDLLGEKLFATDSGTESFVLTYSKSKSPRWKLSHVTEQDFEAVADLFQSVFGHPLRRELWNWKYANGKGNAIVARSHGDVVAHYGGIYRDVLRQGEPYWVFQACDVMVKASERGILTRQGPFFLTAATAAELYGPPAYGFPTARHTLVTTKFGLSCEVGKMVEFRWKPVSSRPLLLSKCRPVDASDIEQHRRIDAMWKALAADLRDAVVGVRSWAYIEKRYVQHPLNRYSIFEVSSRLTNRPLGAIVLRRLEDSCELLDVIGPLKNFSALILHAQRLAALWKLPYVYCWSTVNFSSVFETNGATREMLDLSVLTSCWTPDAQVERYKDRWWLTSGDTDFR